MTVWVLSSLWYCTATKHVSTRAGMTKTFLNESEKIVWFGEQLNQSMTLSIRCTFEPLNRQCYLGSSNMHPITIDDTRLGIPLSEAQTTDGWVQVEGIWRPESDGLSVEQVDLRVDKVLSGSSAPLVVLLH